MRPHMCDAIGCRVQVGPTELFCRRRLAMVESDTRRVLERTFRPGRPMSFVCRQTRDLAQREILFFQTQGHRMPRDRAFDFDGTP